MSTNDSHSGRHVSGSTDRPSDNLQSKKRPPVDREASEEDTVLSKKSSSPALRMFALLMAFVLLLVVLGWALGTII